MRIIGPILGLLKIGRFRDWYRLQWARFRSPGSIEAATVPFITPPWHIRMTPGSKLIIGKNVTIQEGFGVYIERGVTVEIGDNVVFNRNVWLGAASAGIRIGKDSGLGPNTTVLDTQHNFGDTDTPFLQQGVTPLRIEIGRNVWIGSTVTIMASIGDGAVIGANAVVSRDVPAEVLAVGIPARVLKKLGKNHSGLDSREAAPGAEDATGVGADVVE